MGNKYYPTGGDFLPNLHDLLPPLRTRPTFALDNGTKRHTGSLNKKNAWKAMKIALVKGSKWDRNFTSNTLDF